MMSNETETAVFPARPRILARQTIGLDSWRRRAKVWASDVAVEPTGECSGDCTRRRPCDFCYAHDEWQDEVIGLIQESTGWGLYEYNTNAAYSPTGRPFAHAPWAYTRRNRAGTKAIVIVTWTGGLDI